MGPEKNSSIGYSRSKSRSEMGRESALSKKKSPLSLQQYLVQQAYIGRTTPNNTLLPYFFSSVHVATVCCWCRVSVCAAICPSKLKALQLVKWIFTSHHSLRSGHCKCWMTIFRTTMPLSKCKVYKICYRHYVLK